MVLLMVNLMIGIVTRSAPTLNLFSFGFPITLMVVFVLLFFSVSAFAEFKSLIENALFFVDELILGCAMALENEDGCEKTEEPTARKLEQAAENGQRLTVKEMMVFATVSTGVLVLMTISFLRSRAGFGEECL